MILTIIYWAVVMGGLTAIVVFLAALLIWSSESDDRNPEL